MVTFSSQEEIREAVDECIAAAIVAAYRKATDAEIIRKLMNHVDLRFRFAYILGKVKVENDEDDIDNEDQLPADDELALSNQDDSKFTNETVFTILTQIKNIAERYNIKLRRELVQSETDQRIADELFEEELDTLLREDEEFQTIGDQIMEDIRKKFDLMDKSCFEFSRQEWPILWHWENNDRKAFLKEITRFSSNYAPLFGKLLTPLFNGLRVTGPFSPEWIPDTLKLVLIDGEGLGHSAESSSTIPSSLIERFDTVDAILLVDNAEQPMQAAPSAALRAILSSGNVDKLVITFTHFDLVKAPNLETVKDREHHVLATAENTIKHIGNQLGQQAERDLRRRIEFACLYLEKINERLDLSRKAGNRTAQALKRLVGIVLSMGKPIELGEASPIFDRLNLVMAVKGAAETFHEDWRGLLGLAIAARTDKVHWGKVKALNRRLAEGWAEEYGGLAPIAGLWKELREQIYILIKNPLGWGGTQASDDEKQQILD